MNSTDVASLLGIVGIVLSALLGSVGYFFKVRADRKKSSKNVLYYLLEIRHSLLLNHIDPKEVTKSYLEFLDNWSSKNSIGQSPTFPEAFTALIQALMQNSFLAQGSIIDEQLINQFHLALIDLSKDDPILAYRIKGKEKLNSLIGLQDQYAEGLKSLPEIAADPAASQFISEQLHIKKSETIDELVSDLNYDIKLVSKKCGLLTYFKSKTILKKVISRKIDFTELGLDKELETIISNFHKKLMESQ